MSGMLHIASFVVHHRIDAATSIDALLARLPETELALRDGGRSVLLCEGSDERSLVDRIEALRTLDGVISVSLVYHHAEFCEHLMEEIADDHAS